MTVSTLPRYLLGSRDAILSVALSRWSLLIGALFVVSAGFAREYDGEDLLREPWHVLRPLGASLVSGTLLFLLVHVAARRARRGCDGTPPPFFTAYRSFLGLFWMTAPMAWLYAIPYERFMSPVDAVGINLWTLAFVAAWRVVLMIRVIQVIYGISANASFFLVMLFADVVLFAVMIIAPTPVIDVMGGIRHSARDALVASATWNLTILSVITAPIWLFGAMIVSLSIRPRWLNLTRSGTETSSRGLLGFALVSLLAFTPLLLMAQPEQMRRHDAEALLLSGRITEGLALMSAGSATDFPPHWNPPPRRGYREWEPSLTAVRERMSEEWPADWVAEIYVAKIRRALRSGLMPHGSPRSWSDRVTWLLESTSEWQEERIAESEPTIAFLLDHDEELSADDRAALERLLERRTTTPDGEDPDR